MLKLKYSYIKIFTKEDSDIVVRFMSSHCTRCQHIDEAVETLKRIGVQWPL